ncbi:class I SAM-dependent methyltransferase [Candidatus Babeliales bacterium]|nr:class I SAM-dependent methyltransferase [Candidatus Babeliales bacterium]
MHKNILITVSLISLFSSGTIDTFNGAYHGTDALESYETSWGKERFVKEDYLRYFPHYEEYSEKIPYVDIASINLAHLPAPYSSLNKLQIFNNYGMYFNSKYIAQLLKHNVIENVVEIGSYFGLSTRHIASLLPAHGKLYAIDSWAYFDGMYEQFLSNIVWKGLHNKVVPIKQLSQQALPELLSHCKTFDLIYVDGDHETDGVLRDLEMYMPLLSEKGVICGDDWLIRTVRNAVEIFAQKYELTIYAACNFWFLKLEGAYGYKSFLDASDDVWKM